MKRLQNLSVVQPAASAKPRRRGFAPQRSQRLSEQQLRQRVLDFCDWTDTLGWSQLDTAALLQIPARTLRHWQHALAFHVQARALGRPVRRSPQPVRQEVLDLITELGAGVGVPTLRDCFPQMQRAELADLLTRYRRVLRRRFHLTWNVLHWNTPGSVWGMDFLQAPRPIEGRYPYVLAVRDLASGQQLLWRAVLQESAQETTWGLALLFALYGAPLVLKSDNGSAFIAELTQALLASAGVIPLFSPPYAPRYNGATEASNGSLKTRTERHATRHGRPTQWILDDLTAAEAEANTLARPQGEAGPSPEAAWSARRPLSATERALFQETVARLRAEERTKEGVATEGVLDAAAERRIERKAIQRALVEHGYLRFSRRRIPLPIHRKKAASIT